MTKSAAEKLSHISQTTPASNQNSNIKSFMLHVHQSKRPSRALLFAAAFYK